MAYTAGEDWWDLGYILGDRTRPWKKSIIHETVKCLTQGYAAIVKRTGFIWKSLGWETGAESGDQKEIDCGLFGVERLEQRTNRGYWQYCLYVFLGSGDQ